MEEGERFRFVNEGGFHCLDVVPVLVQDGGEWTCIASNDVGRVFSSCHLNVLGTSKINKEYLYLHVLNPAEHHENNKFYQTK